MLTFVAVELTTLIIDIMVSERCERDTIWGVQIRAGAVYINIICMEVRTYAIIVAHAMHM